MCLLFQSISNFLPGLPKITFLDWTPTRALSHEQYEYGPKPKSRDYWWRGARSHHQDTKKRWYIPSYPCDPFNLFLTMCFRQMPLIVLRRSGYKTDDILLAKWMPDTVKNQTFSGAEDEDEEPKGFLIEGPSTR